MSTLIQVGKFLTIDSLIIYCDVYEQVVQQGRRMSDVTATIQKRDEKRDQSAVRKVINNINARFADVYDKPAIVSSDKEAWQSTPIGDELYKFASSIRGSYLALEAELRSYTPDIEEALIYSRVTADEVLFEVRNRAIAEGIDDALRFKTLEATHFEEAFLSGGADFVIDELFFSDKQEFQKAQFRYRQVARHDLMLIANRNIDKTLIQYDDANGERATAQPFIYQRDVEKIAIRVPLIPLSIRMAAAVAAVKLRDQNYLSAATLEVLKRAYPALQAVSADIKSFAFSLNIKEPYGTFLNNDDADQLDKITGHQHLRLPIRSNQTNNLYYNTAIIHERTREHAGASLFSKLTRLIEKMEGELSQNAVTVNNNVIDYSKPYFDCPNCHKQQITYDMPEDGNIVVVPCRNCLYVVAYNVVSKEAFIKKNAKFDIRYSDEMHDEHFHCTECGNVFKPDIKITTKGREFVYCENCHTVYQENAAQSEIVHVHCPADGCDRDHAFKLSDRRTEQTITCYNTLKLIRLRRGEEEATVVGDANVKVMELQNIENINEFPCPHFGCGDKRKRGLIYNKRGEAFSHCNNCEGDIRIIQK